MVCRIIDRVTFRARLATVMMVMVYSLFFISLKRSGSRFPRERERQIEKNMCVYSVCVCVFDFMQFRIYKGYIYKMRMRIPFINYFFFFFMKEVCKNGTLKYVFGIIYRFVARNLCVFKPTMTVYHVFL